MGNRNSNKTHDTINCTNENDILDKHTDFLNRYSMAGRVSTAPTKRSHSIPAKHEKNP